MAKIKYSALVSDMRNKLNGSVASKNRYGSYLRNKVTPVNPQSSYQQNARQLLGSLSSQYRTLTPAQRNSWINGGVNFPFTDIFGDVRHLTGQTLFVKLNANLVKVGSAQITSAPLPVGVPELQADSLTITAAAGAITDLTLAVSQATVPAGFALAVYATPPTIPSRQFVKNLYRYIGVATVAAGEADLLAEFTDRFGNSISAGEQIHIRVALVNTTTGEAGVPSGTSGVSA